MKSSLLKYTFHWEKINKRQMNLPKVSTNFGRFQCRTVHKQAYMPLFPTAVQLPS